MSKLRRMWKGMILLGCEVQDEGNEEESYVGLDDLVGMIWRSRTNE